MRTPGQLPIGINPAELTDNEEAEKDIGKYPGPSEISLRGNRERQFNQLTKYHVMNPKNQLMKKMFLLLVLVASMLGAMAQTKSDPKQSVCPGTEPYLITPDDPANTFLWSIVGGTDGVDWTISSPTTVGTDIVWSSPATPQTYIVTFKELVPSTGCYEEVSLEVIVNPLPVLLITDPVAVCSPVTINLEDAAVTAGSTLPTGTTLSYWTDAAGTTALATPAAVTVSGTYYIKAETAEGCSAIKAVNVIINETLALVITDPAGACSPGTVNLEDAAVTAGSTLPTGTTLSYWTDAAGTTALATPAAVAASGTYYIKAETAEGCSAIKAVNVIINPAPILVITNPAAVCVPGPVNLEDAAVTAGSTLPAGTTLSYWTDAAGTIPLPNPSAVTTAGTYYIKATVLLTSECSDIKAVEVTLNPLPATSPIYHN